MELRKQRVSDVSAESIVNVANWGNNYTDVCTVVN